MNTSTRDPATDGDLGDPIHAAMKSVFGDLASARSGVQSDLATSRQGVAGDLANVRNGITSDLAGGSASDAMGTPRQPSTDSIALAMGLTGQGGQAAKETPIEQARRIMSGKPQPQAGTGDVDLNNAMGVTRLRTQYNAARSERLNVTPYIPTADTPPEIASNNLNYLDMLTLRGAGDSLGAADAMGGGGTTLSGKLRTDPLHLNLDQPQGDMVDQRRARVQAMSDFGNANLATPAEKNRRALIAAMNGVQAPDPQNPGQMITRAPTAEEAMLGFSKAGGTGLTMDAVMKAMDSESMAKTSAAKGQKPDASAEYDKQIEAYRDALGKKDYLRARFWAQKLGHKFQTKEKDATGAEVDIPFSPEQLPGYTADQPAAPAAATATIPAVNSAPNTQVADSPYKTPDDVKAAFKAGTLKRADAITILQKQFGHQ